MRCGSRCGMVRRGTDNEIGIKHSQNSFVPYLHGSLLKIGNAVVDAVVSFRRCSRQSTGTNMVLNLNPRPRLTQPAQSYVHQVSEIDLFVKFKYTSDSHLTACI